MCKERKSVEVVAAIICDGNKVFATQRGYGEWKDWWEFPGGKIEEGEGAEEALRREIREELATDIRVGKKLTTVEWDYPKFHLTMHCFLCEVVDGRLTLLEHEAARWLTKEQLGTVRWLPADEEVVKNCLMKVKNAEAERGRFLEKWSLRSLVIKSLRKTDVLP